jgi:hypothetical protein
MQRLELCSFIKKAALQQALPDFFFLNIGKNIALFNYQASFTSYTPSAKLILGNRVISQLINFEIRVDHVSLATVVVDAAILSPSTAIASSLAR